jgi:ribonuclease-3
MKKAPLGPTKVEEVTGYSFRDRSLLVAALTHASFCNEAKDPTPDNERLEFLGDAIVNAVVAASAFRRFPDAREGDLTRLKAAVVSEPALAERARELGLGDCLRLGKGAAHGDQVGNMPSVLSDAFEALVGAIFMDGGFEAARQFVQAQLDPLLDRAASDRDTTDAKSALQVRCLKSSKVVPRYTTLGHSGPAHSPCFTVQVALTGGRTFTGTGRSKKEAEQAAAHEALRWLGGNDCPEETDGAADGSGT